MTCGNSTFLFLFKFKIYYPRRYDKSNVSSLRMVITPEINSLLCLLVSHSADTAWHMTLSQIIRLWDFIEYSMVNMYHWCILEPLSKSYFFPQFLSVDPTVPTTVTGRLTRPPSSSRRASRGQRGRLTSPPSSSRGTTRGQRAVDSGADWLHRPPLAEAQPVDSVPWTAGQTDSTALL